MILSKNKSFIFIHIQKTAGTSLETILTNHCSQNLKKHWHGRHGHVNAGIKEIGRKEWNKYYSFAFVRNPWERMVSWYTMIQEEKKKLPLNKQKLEYPFDTPFWNHAVRDSYNFESFLVNCTDIIKDRRSIKSYAFNQIDYISDNKGKIAVTFVGRFENFSSDSAKIFNQLGITIETFPKLNTSKHEHYSNYYNNKTKDLIYKRFRRDIDKFDYYFSYS